MGQGATQGMFDPNIAQKSGLGGGQTAASPAWVQSMLGGLGATGSGPTQQTGALPNMQTGPSSPPVFSPQPAMQNMQGQMGGAAGKGGAPQGGAMPPQRTSVGGMTGGAGWTGMR